MLHLLIQIGCTAAPYFPYATDCLPLVSTYSTKAECVKFRDQVNDRKQGNFYGEHRVVVGQELNVGDAKCVVLSPKTMPAGAERYKNPDGVEVVPEAEGPRIPLPDGVDFGAPEPLSAPSTNRTAI